MDITMIIIETIGFMSLCGISSYLMDMFLRTLDSQIELNTQLIDNKEEK